jgi:hypothetical protein
MDCWHQEIERAATEDEVVRSASDYLFLWAPQELAPLTQGWREWKVESAADVERVKRWLTEGLYGAHSLAPAAAQLRELANYFWHACARIAEIRATQMQFARAPVRFALVHRIH